MRIVKGLAERLKWMVARKELDALHRYRMATYEARYYLAHYPESAVLLNFIEGEGEGDDREFVDRMREKYKEARPK